MSGQYFCYLARKESLLNSLNVSKDDQLIERKYSEDDYEGFLQRYPSMDNLHISPFNADNSQPITSFHTDISQPFRSFHTDTSQPFRSFHTDTSQPFRSFHTDTSQPLRSKSVMIKQPKNKALIKNIDNKMDNPKDDITNNNQDLEHDINFGLKLEEQKRWKKRRNTFHNVSLSVEKNLSKVGLSKNTNKVIEDNLEVKTSNNISSASLSKNNSGNSLGDLTGKNNKQNNSSTNLLANQSENPVTQQKVSTNIGNNMTNTPTETKIFKSLSIKDRADSVGSASFINLEQIKDIVTNELHSKLENKIFNSKKVTVWCREISNSINDKVRKLTNNEQKVIVTTYIGSNINNEVNMHVSIKCEKVLNDDDFITIAIEGDTMFAWVSLFIAKF